MPHARPARQNHASSTNLDLHKGICPPPDGLANLARHVLAHGIEEVLLPRKHHCSIRTSHANKTVIIGMVATAVSPIQLPKLVRIDVEKPQRARWHARLARLGQRATGPRSLVVGDGSLAARAAAALPVGRGSPSAIGRRTVWTMEFHTKINVPVPLGAATTHYH